jgi:hypothetical protein
MDDDLWAMTIGCGISISLAMVESSPGAVFLMGGVSEWLLRLIDVLCAKFIGSPFQKSVELRLGRPNNLVFQNLNQAID